MCTTSGSTEINMCLLLNLILQPRAHFSCCQLLITKLSVTIYVFAMYKVTIISIDVITQPMKESYDLLHNCLQKIVILVNFM